MVIQGRIKVGGLQGDATVPVVIVCWHPGVTLAAIERDVILQVVAIFDGNLSRAARELGISRTNLKLKLDMYRTGAKSVKEVRARKSTGLA